VFTQLIETFEGDELPVIEQVVAWAREAREQLREEE
jgi:hypothetical protein